MASQTTTLKNKIETELTNATMLAKIQSFYPSISSIPIIYGQVNLLGAQNRGKKMLIQFWREGAEYTNESDGGAGSLMSSWNITLFLFNKPTGASTLRDEEGYEETGTEIMALALQQLRNNYNLNLSRGTSERIEKVELVPYGYAFTTTFQIHNSWVPTNRT